MGHRQGIVELPVFAHLDPLYPVPNGRGDEHRRVVLEPADHHQLRTEAAADLLHDSREDFLRLSSPSATSVAMRRKVARRYAATRFERVGGPPASATSRSRPVP